MATPMKQGLDASAIRRIADAFAAIDGGFPHRHFLDAAVAGVQRLELRQRVDFLIELLARHLPGDLPTAAGLLERIPEHWDAGQADDPLRGFAAWPIIDYVGRYGLGHPQLSLALLRRLTPLFTAEFAIRPFLQRHTALTLTQMERWCDDPDEQVRRLVSEGSRPRLPWGQRLQLFIDRPGPVLSLLERLKDDPSETVRRSVANNLNDIAKDHPRTVVELCADWRDPENADREWIVRHATRTLVKQGYPGVFGLLGFTERPEVAVTALWLEPVQLSVGDALVFGFDLLSNTNSTQKLVVDYAVHYAKAGGKSSAKVFKLKMVTLGAGETLRLTKSHSFRPVTTRKYYPGQHSVEILANGKPMARQTFTLLV